MADLRKGSGPVLTGVCTIILSWRVEQNSSGGRFGKFARGLTGTDKIDLDAIAMIGNQDDHFVGAAHKGDPQPFDGAVSYGGDTKAREGEAASESIIVDIERLKQHSSARNIVLGVTSYNNASALAKLAALEVKVIGADKSVLLHEMRSIEGTATAALVGKIDVGTGAFVEIDDTFNVPGDAKSWRQLASAARVVLQR